jgi:hypothetical protein
MPLFYDVGLTLRVGGDVGRGIFDSLRCGSVIVPLWLRCGESGWTYVGRLCGAGFWREEAVGLEEGRIVMMSLMRLTSRKILSGRGVETMRLQSLCPCCNFFRMFVEAMSKRVLLLHHYY